MKIVEYIESAIRIIFGRLTELTAHNNASEKVSIVLKTATQPRSAR